MMAEERYGSTQIMTVRELRREKKDLEQEVERKSIQREQSELKMFI